MVTTRYGIGCVVLTLVASLAAGPNAALSDEAVTVKGTVTLDGKPLPGGRIIFHLGADQFVGAKIKDGAFKLDRAPAGTHKVTVESPGLPARYTSEEQSALRVEVKKGANELTFYLKSR